MNDYDLQTQSELAISMDIHAWRISYVVISRKIKPTAIIGGTRFYNTEARQEIIDKLSTVQAKRSRVEIR
ncbi:MAG: hypothetical protein IH984_10895 [Planctomycetes bacterium]|nr:hypothetical protein [Planctomycetota bacterium]